MQKNRRKSHWLAAALASLIFGTTMPCQAFKHGQFYAGIGYYSQNFLGRITQKADGSASFIGEPSYPLLLKYDYNFSGSWFLSPQLTYTLLPRDTAGNNAKVTILHLVLPLGQNFSETANLAWDWYAGPGLINYNIQGSGGTETMNNGTSTAVFAVPGASASVRKITLNIGASLNFGSSRFGADLITENALSTTKRAESFMLSYAYQFGGGRY